MNEKHILNFFKGEILKISTTVIQMTTYYAALQNPIKDLPCTWQEVRVHLVVPEDTKITKQFSQLSQMLTIK